MTSGTVKLEECPSILLCISYGFDPLFSYKSVFTMLRFSDFLKKEKSEKNSAWIMRMWHFGIALVRYL